MSVTVEDPDAFIELPLTTAESTLTDLGVSRLEATWDGWTVADGDPEEILLSGGAAIIVNALQMAASMPLAAFIGYGTKMLGVPYQQGSPAAATLVFTAQDDQGPYTASAGQTVYIDGYGFKLAEDVTVPAGETTAEGLVVAAENDPAYGGLTGATMAPGSTPPTFVGFAITGDPAQTIGGVAAQTDPEYASDLSTELRLTSRAVITAPDYELAAVALDGILRAHCEIDPDTLDVDVWLLANAGDPPLVSEPLKDTLAAVYASKRVVNFEVALHDPSFNGVAVTWSGTAYPGQDPDDVQTRANAALTAELSSTGWGAPTQSDPGAADATTWFNRTTVKAMRLVAVIGNVVGMYEVDSLSINGGANFADFAMNGPVPLPVPGEMDATVVVGS